jgi:hypothetical protein
MFLCPGFTRHVWGASQWFFLPENPAVHPLQHQIQPLPVSQLNTTFAVQTVQNLSLNKTILKKMRRLEEARVCLEMFMVPDNFQRQSPRVGASSQGDRSQELQMELLGELPKIQLNIFF